MTSMLITGMQPRIEFLRHGPGLAGIAGPGAESREETGSVSGGEGFWERAGTEFAKYPGNFDYPDTVMSDTSARYYVSGIHSKQPWFVLSAARYFSVAGSDNPSISHFYGFEAGRAADQTMAIPDGCIDILFDCNENRPEAKVCGTSMKATRVPFHPGHRYFGVRFVPGVIPDFLDASAEEVVGQELDLLDAAPVVRDTFEQIVSQREFALQARIFSRFYADKKPRQASDATNRAVLAIEAKHGNIRIRDLEKLTGCTTRTLQRQFHSDIGMSPKVFCRIIRCQSAVYDINHREKLAFSDLACDLGFSDQSHFLREFKQLVSTTPVDYQRRIQSDTYVSRLRCG